MDSKLYERLIKDFVEKDTTQETLFAGLSSEVGEVLGERVKETRNSLEKSTEILDELGDVLWYITVIAASRGSSLGQLMINNYYKLEQRKITGKVK
jgi:NTP pyrophosphatase (non-canonical NTP hydrolase)